jgi:peptide/nickel transport system substrate-binding protein/oligopeptide transport system substrate-binding protein
MIQRKKILGIATVIAAGALALTACGSSGGGSSTTSAAAKTGGTYSVEIQNPQDLVPSNCYDLYCANVLLAIDTGIYNFETQADGSVKPVPTALTKSVTSPDNGKTYQIEINPGWKFTNGEAVTAKTFVDTYNFAALGTNGQQLGFIFGASQLNVVGYADVSDAKAPKAKTMSGLKLVNDTTFSIELVNPLGPDLFANFLAGPQILPMPSVATASAAAADTYGKNPIGNGAYKLSEPWTPNQKITLVKNPDFKGTPGNADEIDFRIYNDDNAAWADLQAGNLDILGINGLPQTALATAPSVLGDRYVNTPGALSFGYYGFPTQTPTFKNKDVRVAIRKAINYQDIIDKLLFKTASVALSFAPSTIPGGGTDVCGDSCVFDAAKAKSLYTAAGGVPGNAIQIGRTQGGDNTVAKAVCNQLQTNLGIKCTLKLFPDFGAMLDAYAKLGPSDTGFILSLGWGADNPTINNMIAPNFSKGAASNYIGYNNPQFDALITKGNAETDAAKQQADWLQAETIFYGDFQAFATTFPNTNYGYSTHVSNVKISPQGFVNLTQITVN